jgi:hypothetical protein
MKQLLAFFVLLVGIYFALLVQEFLPAFPQFGGARLQFVPLIFCIGALALPFPLMLLLALTGGFLFDIMQMQIVNNHPEIAPGTTVFFFLLAGVICQGVRPLFLRRHWYLAGIAGALATAGLLTMQFLLLSFRRFESGGLFWNENVLWRILFPSLVALIAAPLFFFIVRFVLGPFPFKERKPRYH